MNKKNIEDKFSEDIDSYLNGIEKIDALKDEKYYEIFKVGKLLANKDFSKDIDNDHIYEKCLKNIKDCKGDNIMKKIKLGYKIAAASIVAVIASACIMQTSFAKDLSSKIANVVSIANSNSAVVEYKEDKKSTTSNEVPSYLKGKLFDKNGKPIKKYSAFDDENKYYTANGEKIAYIANGKPVTEAENEKLTGIIKNINDINKYLAFKVSIPSYLPEGYSFDMANVFKDNAGNVSNKCVSLFFTNSKTKKQIYIQERLDCKETQYYASSDGPVEKIKINNVDAVASNHGHGIDWKNNNCLYMLVGNSVSPDEVKKVAESMK